jgi:hypothetical protein
MIDLETMDTSPSAIVLSVGAVVFDPDVGTVDEGEGFNAVLNIQSQLNAGRTLSGGTLKWWFKQSDEAIRAWNKDDRQCQPLEMFVDRFQQFWHKSGVQFVWSHGSVFDIMILENMGIAPWKFWDIRDTRTLFHKTGVTIGRGKGTHHTALDDAVAQAHAVCKAWKV